MLASNITKTEETYVQTTMYDKKLNKNCLSARVHLYENLQRK